MPTPTTIRVVLRKKADKKHSVVFESTEKDALIDTVYIKRPFCNHWVGCEMEVRGWTANVPATEATP